MRHWCLVPAPRAAEGLDANAIPEVTGAPIYNYGKKNPSQTQGK